MRRNSYLELLSKYFWLIFFAGIMNFVPELAFAADGVALTNTSNSAFFTPAPNDQSIIYLGELFGSIPPILAGTGSGLMGSLFKLFNTAVLTLGIIFAGYTTFVGILNTAGDGEMLGKGWSSIWVPIKTVAGIALLIPTGSGYCVIQVFMMWLLVQGIGAADTLTGAVVDYMESGQKVFVKGNTPDSQGETSMIKTWDTYPITIAYQGLSCMQAYQKQFPEVNATYVTPPAPEYPIGANKIVYNFMAYEQTGTDSTGAPTSKAVSCGQILIDNDPTNTSKSEAIDVSEQNLIASFIVQGLNAIMPSLNSAAYFMVNDVPVVTSPNTTEEQQTMQDTFNFVGSDFMNEVATTYNSYVIQANNTYTKPQEDSYYEDVRSYGWVTLGNLYWDMAKSSSTSGSDQATETAKLNWSTSSQNIGDTKYKGNYTPDAYLYGYTYANQFIADLIASRKADNNGNVGFESVEESDYSQAASGVISSMTLTILEHMEDRLNNGENPMVAAQRLGHHISLDVETSLTFLMITLTGTAIYAGIYSSVSPSFLILQTAMAMALPGIMVFAGVMLVLGGALAVIIPFIPAMAYFLAVVAWMTSTLETMVAAPIVAIGVVHPEGHAVWGKAEPAIMLMTNMFLRPSLIVIGMAAGVILSFITVQFVNFGFAQAMASMLGGTSPSSMEASLFLTSYVGLILACVNKSFSTIDIIPEQVMRWIQGGEATKFGGGQEAAQKLQGSQESGGQKAGGDTASSGQEASQAGEKTGAKADKQAERKKDPIGNSKTNIFGK